MCTFNAWFHLWNALLLSLSEVQCYLIPCDSRWNKKKRYTWPPHSQQAATVSFHVKEKYHIQSNNAYVDIQEYICQLKMKSIFFRPGKYHYCCMGWQVIPRPKYLHTYSEGKKGCINEFLVELTVDLHLGLFFLWKEESLIFFLHVLLISNVCYTFANPGENTCWDGPSHLIITTLIIKHTYRKYTLTYIQQ